MEPHGGDGRGLAQVHLAVPSCRQTHGMPWEAFPALLSGDVGRYLDRLAHVDPLAMDGPDQPLRPRPIETRRIQLRRGASALVQEGMEPDTLACVADLAGILALAA